MYEKCEVATANYDHLIICVDCMVFEVQDQGLVFGVPSVPQISATIKKLSAENAGVGN